MVNPVRYIHPRSLKHLASHLDLLTRAKLWVQILIGMALGIGTGILLGPSVGLLAPETAKVVGGWLALPGKLFLAMIQMIVIPLIFSSVIRGLAASEDVSQLRSVGLKVVGFFVVTTVIGIVIGLGVSGLIRPGDYIDQEMIRQVVDVEVPETSGEFGGLPSFSEVPEQVIGLLPENPLGSLVQTEMLQIVIFAIFIGIALLSMAPKQARPLLDLLGSLQEVCMTVVRWAMLIAPLAVFGLLANLTATVGLEVLVGMAVYVGTVLGGLLLLMLVYLLIMAFIGHSPWRFLGSIREVQLLAFSTSSSAAVMPLSIRTADEKLGVRPSISQFVIPLGATINMNGTALYQGAATVFVAQVFGVELSLAALAFVVVTAVSASIGAPATPGVGIVILATLLEGVGIPAAGVALLIGVDRILDMSRTAINVTGDLTACAVMDKWVGGKLTASEERAREEQHESHRAQTGEDVLAEPAGEAPAE
ncbi:MAG: cation:dicarboxylase symporter family transporter [Candidatus Eisenbacteria bacterium]|nr:cation:dicarboxylase symporter family transporter [Candidatus Eisenbacteria bacterium]